MFKTQVWWLSLLIGLILITTPVSGQLHRNFPPNSQLGTLTALSFPQFTINGQIFVMGASGQIRGTNNLIMLPNMVNQTGPVRYQLDIMGNLHRIWFLTQEEANHAAQEALQRKR